MLFVIQRPSSLSSRTFSILYLGLLQKTFNSPPVLNCFKKSSLNNSSFFIIRKYLKLDKKIAGVYPRYFTICTLCEIVINVAIICFTLNI